MFEDDQQQKWRTVLQSIVNVILFLSKHNLPFRGHR